MGPPSEEVQEWLDRADGDLEMARRGLEGPEPLPPEAAFHCQQAAEKALKALLSHHAIRVERTHNLPRLITQLQDAEPGIGDHMDAASTLTPYGVAVRYPGAPDPSEADAQEALELATTMLEDIRARLDLD